MCANVLHWHTCVNKCRWLTHDVGKCVTKVAMAYSKVGDVKVHILKKNFYSHEYFKEVTMYSAGLDINACPLVQDK